MANTTNIGTFHLLKDHTFCDRGYECAAWYQNIEVKAGDYPLYIHNYTERERENGILIGCYSGADVGYVALDGVVTGADFGARFYGVPIGGDNSERYIGREDTYHWSAYLYSIAGYVHDGGMLCDSDGEPYACIELNPEYEAREVTRWISEFTGEEHVLYDIYKKEV